MNTLAAVCVYDRLINVQRWIEIWRASYTRGSELLIIHAIDEGNLSKHQPMRDLCVGWENIHLWQRPNQGFGTGCMQAILQRRFPVESDPDYFFWATDDSLPMRPDFLQDMREQLRFPSKCGVIGAETSDDVRYHLRTNFFMLRMELARQIEFPDINCKQDEYGFEHASPNCFTNQILNRGLEVRVLDQSYCWDTDHHITVRNRIRWEELWTMFPKTRELGSCQR